MFHHGAMHMKQKHFTEEQVLIMRTNYRNGLAGPELAVTYGVSKWSMMAILAGRSYKKAPFPPPLLSRKNCKSLPQFPGYEFDSEGNAYSFRQNKRYGRQIKTFINKSNGYVEVSLLATDGTHHLRRLNRIICTIFHGPPPTPEHETRHLNGIRTDNRAINLVWGTKKENAEDRVIHGTQTYGEKANGAKLTEAIVKNIRSSIQSVKELAQRYNVNDRTIYSVKKRQSWKHVP